MIKEHCFGVGWGGVCVGVGVCVCMYVGGSAFSVQFDMSVF